MSNLIWTNHLEERLRQRGITRNEAYDAINYPSRSVQLGTNKWKFFKDYDHKQVVIVAVSERGQWIILTSWSKPVGYRPKGGYSEVSQPWISRMIQSGLVKLVEWIQGLVGK